MAAASAGKTKRAILGAALLLRMDPPIMPGAIRKATFVL